MMEIKQSTSAYALVFYMVDSTDHVTPKTGLSPTVTLSKNGGSFASPSGSVTEISGGFYKVAGNTTDSNTLGMLVLKATATGADPVAMSYCVVANLAADEVAQTTAAALQTSLGLASGNLDTQLSAMVPNVWLSFLPIEVSVGGALTSNGSTPVTFPRLYLVRNGTWSLGGNAWTDSGTYSGNNYVLIVNGLAMTLITPGLSTWGSANLGKTWWASGAATGTPFVSALLSRGANIAEDVRTNLATELGRIDVAVSTRNATPPPTAASIASAVWDRLLTGITTAGSIGKKLKDWVLGTDNKVLLSTDEQTGVTIPVVTTLTNAPTVPSAPDIASAVRTNLATELGRIDVAVSTRNATPPPSAADNASAVRTNLATELGLINTNLDAKVSEGGDPAAVAEAVSQQLAEDFPRLPNVATVESTAAQIAAASP